MIKVKRAPPVRQYEGYIPVRLGSLKPEARFILVIDPAQIIFDGKVLGKSQSSVRVSYNEINKKEGKIRYGTSEWSLMTEVIVKLGEDKTDVSAGEVRRTPVLENVPGKQPGQSAGSGGFPPTSSAGVARSAEEIRDFERKLDNLRRNLREKFPPLVRREK